MDTLILGGPALRTCRRFDIEGWGSSKQPGAEGAARHLGVAEWQRVGLRIAVQRLVRPGAHRRGAPSTREHRRGVFCRQLIGGPRSQVPPGPARGRGSAAACDRRHRGER